MTALKAPASRRDWRRLVTLQGLLLLGPWMLAAAWELVDPGGSGRSVVVSLDGDTRRSGVPLHFDMAGAFTMSVLPFVAYRLFGALGWPRLARLVPWAWAWLAPVMVVGFLAHAAQLAPRRSDGALQVMMLTLIVTGVGGLFAMLVTSLLVVLGVIALPVTAPPDGRLNDALAVLPIVVIGIAFDWVSLRYGVPIGVYGALDAPSPFYLATPPACAAVLLSTRRRVPSGPTAVAEAPRRRAGSA